jgi:hypothetical protein
VEGGVVIVELATLVSDFAEAMSAADARKPIAMNHRGDRAYQAGIGPHAESTAVNLTIDEMRLLFPGRYPDVRTVVPYPHTRQTCDLMIGSTPGWAIEVKMARFSGDNGKQDDTAIKDILSPYDRDRSALSDCRKLASAGFPQRTAVLIYGFDDARRPLDPILEAFQTLASHAVWLGERQSAPLRELVHPVFAAGRVVAWEVRSL